MRASLVAPLLLVACSPSSDPAGETSTSEDKALNDAAAMLDANSVEGNAVGIVPNRQEQPE